MKSLKNFSRIVLGLVALLGLSFAIAPQAMAAMLPAVAPLFIDPTSGVLFAVIPSLAELQRYNVNRPDQVEAIRQSLWDTQTYVDNSTTQLQFFQIPNGQSSKTLADTNMEAAGSLPAPKSFLVETIELYVYPGNTIAADSTTIAASKNLNDIYQLTKTGWLDLFIGSKSYLIEGPLMKFPPRSGIGGIQVGADSTANTGVRVDYATLGGPVYELDPPILLVPTQNFKITLNWASAIDIGANATIVCNLGGILYRNSQ